MKGLPRSNRRRSLTDLTAPVQKLVYRFEDKAFTVANGSSAPGIGNLVIGDLPAGNILVIAAAVKNLVFETADADATSTWDGDFSVGSAPNADADLTDATDFDIVGSSGGTAIGAATAKVSPAQNVQTVKNAVIVNTDGSKEVNLNVMVDDASQSGDIAMTASGTIEILYSVF